MGMAQKKWALDCIGIPYTKSVVIHRIHILFTVTVVTSLLAKTLFCAKVRSGFFEKSHTTWQGQNNTTVIPQWFLLLGNNNHLQPASGHFRLTFITWIISWSFKKNHGDHQTITYPLRFWILRKQRWVPLILWDFSFNSWVRKKSNHIPFQTGEFRGDVSKWKIAEFLLQNHLPGIFLKPKTWKPPSTTTM